MAPHKTLYVSKEDLPTWEAAEKLPGSLSKLVTELLKKEVQMRMGTVQGPRAAELSTIVVDVEVDGRERKLSFQGMWLLFDEREDTEDAPLGTTYSVALTKKGQLFFMRTVPHYGSHHEVFATFAELVDSGELPPGLAAEVAKALAVDHVEELDI